VALNRVQYTNAADFAQKYGQHKAAGGHAGINRNGPRPGGTLAKQEYGPGSTLEEATAGWAK
jgi:hypothetical protein